jgi:hypothetical protein
VVAEFGFGELTELGREGPDAATTGLERKPECDETVRRLEDERLSARDVDCTSLAILLLLRKLEGSSRERDVDGDGEGWDTSPFGIGDEVLAHGDVGDDGLCGGAPSARSNFASPARRSRSRSSLFALLVAALACVGGVAMSPTPTVFSHKFPMRPFPAAAGGHLYTRNAVPSRTQSVRRHFRSRDCTPGAENSILRGIIARK